MRRSDAPRLHAAHGQAGHGAVWLIRESAEVGVDVGNQVLDDHLLERAEVERPVRPGRRPPSGWATDAAVLHHDDERLAFPSAIRLSIIKPVWPGGPNLFHLRRRRVADRAPGSVCSCPVVIGRRVNVDVTRLVAGFREVIHLAQLPMRHILERVEIRVLRRNLNRAAPATGAVEVVTVRIGHLSPIDLDGVIVKTFIQGACSLYQAPSSPLENRCCL